MDEIRDLLQRLTTLTEDELATLRSLVVEEFKRLDGEPTSVDSTALMNELADIGEQAMAEGKAREEAQAQAEADKDAARQRIAAISGDSEDEPSEEEAPAEETEETPEEETPEAEVPAEEETPAEVPEPVAATGAVQRMARAAGKPTPSPEAATQRVAGVLTASAGHDRGRPISDREELAREFADQLDSMPKDGPNRGKVIVASAKADYPPERKLTSDAEANARLFEAVSGLHAQKFDRRTGALVATGGICAPVNVDYAVPTYATSDRPLKDGLVSFETPRGGVRFVQPPDLAEWEAATGIWSEATDAEPAGATKPIVALACGTEMEALVEAVTTRVGFGNMQSRFAPEQVAANTDLAIAAAARVAENNLLKLIEATAVKDITNTKHLGASRDFLSEIDETVAMYRWVHRLPRTQALTAIFPDFLREMFRTDLARESAHQQDSTWNSLMVTDEQIDDLLAAHGVNAIWHIDGQPAKTGGEAYPLQGFTADTAAAEFKKYPTKIVWYFFAEGQINFLDGGRLDLGVVRDSTLDATNDYETFVETFEGIAPRGFKNGVLQLVTEVEPTGASSGTITPVAP
jgi:hypothetical protein